MIKIEDILNYIYCLIDDCSKRGKFTDLTIHVNLLFRFL